MLAGAAVLAALAMSAACGGGGGDDGGVASASERESTSESSSDSSSDSSSESSSGSAGRVLADEEPEGGRTNDEQQGLLDFAACMRDNGIDMPDPEAGPGGLQTAMSDAIASYDRDVLFSALEECRDLLPSQTVQRAESVDSETELAFAECLREQGLDVPDDVFTSGVPDDIDPDQLSEAMTACQEVWG